MYIVCLYTGECSLSGSSAMLNYTVGYSFHWHLKEDIPDCFGYRWALWDWHLLATTWCHHWLSSCCIWWKVDVRVLNSATYPQDSANPVLTYYRILEADFFIAVPFLQTQINSKLVIAACYTSVVVLNVYVYRTYLLLFLYIVCFVLVWWIQYY